MLTAFLAKLPAEVWHLVSGWLGIRKDDLHEWLEGFCPCDIGE